MNLDGESLSLESFKKIVLGNESVSLSKDALQRIKASRSVVDTALKKGETVYSLNTGFGILSKVRIEPTNLSQLQTNLIRSHCAGVGEPHTETESRAILLLRANVLAKGCSGVRHELVEILVQMLNKGVHPVIPQQGSVGASGDLAPLAHLAAVAIGEGEAFVKGTRLPGGEALKKVGLKPIELAPKEGISLINGTQQMTGIGCLVMLQAEQLADLADLICTASLEGVLGTPRAYDSWVQTTRPYDGQIQSAKRMRRFMENSEIYESHIHCDRVQDPYSFRCAPQVHGAVRDLMGFVRKTLTTELNSATDNPLVNAETGELISNGNFHGQPVAFALDILAMAISELGSLSERRSAKLIDPHFSDLPTFLVKNEGLNSGFMMAQVTAAALVSENKLLTHPASTDSIPTNNEKEDHVSMGPIAARKAKRILENTANILAIEALCAAQALDFRKPLKAGVGPRLLHQLIRKEVPMLENDRVLTPDIEKIASHLLSGLYHAKIQEQGLLNE